MSVDSHRSARVSMLLILFVVLSCLLVACGPPSEVEDPKADVTISGRLLHGDGSPVTGTDVTLAFEDSPIFGKGHTRVSTTDNNGAYSFQLKGKDLNYPDKGGVRRFDLFTYQKGAEGSRPGISIHNFVVNREQLQVDLQFWEPQTQMSDGKVSWGPLTSEQGTGSGYGLFFDARRDPPTERVPFGSIWGVGTDEVSASVDPRVLEDTRGRFFLEAKRERKVPGTDLNISYLSDYFSYEGSAGPPFSRGRACYLQNGSSRQPLTPCPVTDGNLYQPALPIPTYPGPNEMISPSPTPAPPWVVVDLGLSIRVELVVLRDCSCPVEVALDGNKWSSLGKPSKGVIVPVKPTVARFIRVRVSEPRQLPELSVWGSP